MKATTLIAASLLCLSSLANASDHSKNGNVKYNGPVNLDSIEELLKDTGYFTEKDVVVEGKLVRQISADTFILSDGKTEIQVELDDDITLKEPIESSQKLRLFGEYEGGNTPEIEVEYIQTM